MCVPPMIPSSSSSHRVDSGGVAVAIKWIVGSGSSHASGCWGVAVTVEWMVEYQVHAMANIILCTQK